jgi:hypothetical protein
MRATAKPKALDRNEGRKSPNWAFFTELVIRGRTGEVYLRRLRMVKTPWFGVYLHRIYRPDDDRALHDHPWPFASFVLCGEYEEVVPDDPAKPLESWLSCKVRLVRWFNFKRAADLHRISWVSQSPVWTLVFHARRCREWGFFTERGWIASSEFED